MTFINYFGKVCWNTRSWIRPSGDAPRVENPDTYASRMGFGHEEWLFNFNWIVDGWKYSFLQPVNESRARLEGQVINIRLFTVGGTNGWFYVGEISQCEILTLKQANYARDQFKARGWLQEMEQHVRAVGGVVGGLRGSDPRDLFNIRFRKKDAELYDPIVPVGAADAIRKIKRYRLVLVRRVPEIDRQWARRAATVKARPTGKVPRKAIPAGHAVRHDRKVISKYLWTKGLASGAVGALSRETRHFGRHRCGSPGRGSCRRAGRFSRSI